MEEINSTVISQGFGLSDFLVLLIASVIVIPLFKRMKLSPILGYLVAGAFIGPFGLKVIDDVHDTHIIAEYGVVFLLFTIGLELSFERLRVMKRYVFGLGGAQFIITGLLLGFVAHELDYSLSASIVLGGGLALSSTALVIKLLSDRSELSTRYGRSAFSVLLFQDLAVVPLLAITPLMNQSSGDMWSVLGGALIKAFVALFGIILIGRTMLRPLYRVVALTKSPEVFVSLTLLAVLGTGWATYSAGLSMALGAFLAGLLIAETEYGHQVEADIQPFRGILLGFFFMSVGMQINFSLAINHMGEILLMVAGLMIIKSFVLFIICRLFKIETTPSLKIAIILSQGGEFAFVLLNQAIPAGIVSEELGQVIYVVVAFSMALTPMIVSLFWPLLEKLEKQTNTRLEWLAEETEDLRDHVIVAGYGRVGKTVTKILAARSIPFVAVDIDAGRVAKGRVDGMPVYYGDASLAEVMRAVGASRAKAIVLTLSDARLTARAVANVHISFPNTDLIVRAKDGHHVRELHRLGADRTVPETLEASLQLGGLVLKRYGVGPSEIDDLIGEFRRQGIFPDAHPASSST